MTTIAIIGAGNIGGTLARKWAEAGHRVVIGARNPAGTPSDMGGTAMSVAAAVEQADVVLFALPGSAMPEVAASLGSALDAKIVIDATNNIGAARTDGLAAIGEASPSAVAARAFNSLGWENFADPDFGGVQADLLWCGPDGDAGATVEGLIADVGLRPIRVGGLDQLPAVNMLTGLWFALALAGGRGRHLAFKVLTD